LIPPIERVARLEAKGGINWVLIVEKDVSCSALDAHTKLTMKAVFQTLLGLNLLGYPGTGSGILITVSWPHISRRIAQLRVPNREKGIQT
jgi:hypothetical protein